MKRYYKGTLDSVYNIVSQELDYLKKKEEIPTDRYELYGVIEYGNKFDKSKKGTSNTGTLYAHVSLEKNVTFLKRVNDKILISYGDYFYNVFLNI